MMQSRVIIRMLKADGWVYVGAEGDHAHFEHPTKPGKITAPHPAHDVKLKTVISIEKQSGLRLRTR
jgi:predicted RNA binding protein YcfA (HicA-like mRNA interferase family)